MPRYSYICDACDHAMSVFKLMSQYERVEICPGCGAEMKRDFTAGTPATLDKAFRKPIKMYSVAPRNPQELADFRKRCPNVKLTRDLVPIAYNRAEKLRILKAVDFQELS